jgi:hypothetical protein
LQTVRDIVVTILLVLIEFAAVAVIVAPRTTARWVKARLRSLLPRPERAQDSVRRRGAAHPSREGT